MSIIVLSVTDLENNVASPTLQFIQNSSVGLAGDTMLRISGLVDVPQILNSTPFCLSLLLILFAIKYCWIRFMYDTQVLLSA